MDNPEVGRQKPGIDVDITLSLATKLETIQATHQKGVSIRSRVVMILPVTQETLIQDTQGEKLGKKLKMQGEKSGNFEPRTKSGR